MVLSRIMGSTPKVVTDFMPQKHLTMSFERNRLLLPRQTCHVAVGLPFCLEIPLKSRLMARWPWNKSVMFLFFYSFITILEVEPMILFIHWSHFILSW